MTITKQTIRTIRSMTFSFQESQCRRLLLVSAMSFFMMLGAFVNQWLVVFLLHSFAFLHCGFLDNTIAAIVRPQFLQVFVDQSMA